MQNTTFYTYTNAPRRNPAIYPAIVALIAFSGLLYLNDSWFTIPALGVLYPIWRYSKPNSEEIRIEEKSIFLSANIFTTHKTRFDASEILSMFRMCEKSVTQSQYGPVYHQDWTINIRTTDNRIHRTEDRYPPEFNLELYRFCNRNKIESMGLEETLRDSDET